MSSNYIIPKNKRSNRSGWGNEGLMHHILW